MAASLDLIAAQVQRVLDEQAEIRDRLDALKEALASVRETVGQRNREMMALTSIAVRYAREPVDWGSLRDELHNLHKRVEALEHGAR